MKRALSIVVLSAMLIAVVLSITACSERGNVNDAISKTKGLTSLDVDVYTKINADIGDKAQNYELVEEILISGDKVQLTKGEYGRQGNTVYMDGEYAYTKNDSGYTKASLDEYIKENGSYDEKINGLFKKLPSSFFQDADISKTGKKLNMEKDIDGEMLTGTFGDLVGLLQKELGLQVDNPEKTEYKDCKLSLTVKEGYITEMSLQYNALFTSSKKKCTANIKIAVAVNNPGSEVTVATIEKSR